MDLLKDKRQKDWFWIENKIIDSGELTIYEKMIYMVLVRHANEDSSCFPSYKTIAKKAGCSERKAKDVVKSLEEKKLIAKRTRKQGGKMENDTNIYYVLSFKEENITPKDEENVSEVVHEVHNVVHGVHKGGACGAQQVVHEVHPNNTKLNNTNITKKNNKKTFDENSIEFRLAKFLFSHIQKNNPNAKKPNFQKWARDFGPILGKDNRPLEEVKEIIKWSQQPDNFWRSVRSPKGLKNNYDAIWEARDREYQQKQTKINKKVRTIEDELAGFEVY